MDTKLFTSEQIKKFTDILWKLNRGTCNWYKGYNKNSPDYIPCQHEVFINRSINKWFAGRYLVWYFHEENSPNVVKKYIYITRIYYSYSWDTDKITIYYLDYSHVEKGIQQLYLTHNEMLDLEGEWCENGDKHNMVYEMFKLDIPEREFVFKAFDWDKYPKRGVSKEKAIAKITTTKSFFAQTYHQAYIQKHKWEEKNTTQLYIGELIEVKQK